MLNLTQKKEDFPFQLNEYLLPNFNNQKHLRINDMTKKNSLNYFST